jgi:hypothetical protein
MKRDVLCSQESAVKPCPVSDEFIVSPHHHTPCTLKPNVVTFFLLSMICLNLTPNVAT